MKDQHEKIKGYRDLGAVEIALMNDAKELAEQCGKFIARLRTYPDANKPALYDGNSTLLDQRWIAIGATDIQKGFMSVIRGIAQPTTF